MKVIYVYFLLKPQGVSPNYRYSGSNIISVACWRHLLRDQRTFNDYVPRVNMLNVSVASDTYKRWRQECDLGCIFINKCTWPFPAILPEVVTAYPLGAAIGVLKFALFNFDNDVVHEIA